MDAAVDDEEEEEEEKGRVCGWVVGRRVCALGGGRR